MIPLNFKGDLTKRTRSKGYDTANEVYHKYGKDYPIRDYINEYRNGTNAKEIIMKAGGLQNLPHALERIKDSEVVVNMNEDIFTINRKLKLGQIAQRKYDAIQAEKARVEAEAKANEGVKEGE